MPKEQLRIQGLVTIRQGDKILVKEAQNSWVDAGLKGLTSALVGSYARVTQNGTIEYWSSSLNSDTPRMYLGSDTATATVHGATALTTPIGTAPGTAPNAISGVDRTNPSSGTFQTSITAEWYAGAVSGTVGEIALYIRPFTSLVAQWTSQNLNWSIVMVARVSSAGGDFTSFTINTALSLTVEWVIKAVFA